MIDAKQLRLGNFVTINNPKSWPEKKDIPMTVIGYQERGFDKSFPEATAAINLRCEDDEFSQFDVFIDPIQLNEEWLIKLGLSRVLESPFETIKMPYWVKDRFILFYNESQPEYKWLVGYGEMRMGIYIATTSVWIDKIHEVQNHYFYFTGKELV